NSAEYVDEYGFHRLVGKQDAKCILDLFDVGASAGVQKIGRTSTGELYDIHGGHRQARAVHQAGDVAIQFDVGQPEAGSLHFQGIFLVQIAQLDQVLVTKHGVIVQIHFGVERVDLAVLGQDEGID